ncbi:unnamed protein product, partial [Ectocarpus sp. 6 AP-2014]
LLSRGENERVRGGWVVSSITLPKAPHAWVRIGRRGGRGGIIRNHTRKPLARGPESVQGMGCGISRHNPLTHDCYEGMGGGISRHNPLTHDYYKGMGGGISRHNPLTHDYYKGMGGGISRHNPLTHDYYKGMGGGIPR